MVLGTKEIYRLAHLARISVTPEEAADIGDKLSRIFALIEQMQAVDTTHVAPMSHAVDLAQPLRADTVTETDQRAVLQKIAPEVEAGLYLVPKVIE